MMPTLGAGVSVPLVPMAHTELHLPAVWEQGEDAIVGMNREQGATAAQPPSFSRSRISTNG